MDTILAKNMALSEIIGIKDEFDKEVDLKNIYSSLRNCEYFDDVTNKNDISSGLEVYTLTIGSNRYKVVFRVIDIEDTTKNNILNGKQQYITEDEKRIIERAKQGLEVLMIFDNENRDTILNSFALQLKILNVIMPNYDVVLDHSAYKILNKTWVKMILNKEISPISEDLFSIHTKILQNTNEVYCFTTGLLRMGLCDIQAIIPRDNYMLYAERINRLARALINKDIINGNQGEVISGEPGCAYTLIESENGKIFCKDKASPNLDMKIYFSKDDIENRRMYDIVAGEELYENNYKFVSLSEFNEEHKLALETENILLKNIGIHNIKVKYRKKQENETIEAEWIDLLEIEDGKYKGNNIYDEYIYFDREDLISWKINIDNYEINMKNCYILKLEKRELTKDIKKGIIQTQFPLVSSVVGVMENDIEYDIYDLDRILKRNYEFEILDHECDNEVFSCKILWNMEEYIVNIRKIPNLSNIVKERFLDYNQEILENDMSKIYNSNMGIEVAIDFKEDIIDSYRFQLKVLNTVFPDYCAVLDMSSRKILNKNWVKAITEKNLIPFIDDLFNICWRLTEDKQNLICCTYGLIRCGMRDIQAYLSHEIHDKINGAIKNIARAMVLDRLRSYSQGDILIDDIYGSYTLIDDKNYHNMLDNNRERYLTLKIYLYNRELLNILDNRVYNYFISIDIPYYDQEKLDLVRRVAKFSEKDFLTLYEKYESAVCINKNNENIWLENIEYNNFKYTGKLMYDSNTLDKVKGETVTLESERLVDWLLKIDEYIITGETFYLLEEI